MQSISDFIRNGGVIAYPTEGVYGLGCDPFNEAAVMKLLALKQREVGKGVIVIAADFSQAANLVADPQLAQREDIANSWPGHNTWVFPAAADAPRWITGDHDSIAIRVTAHPVARELCLQCQGPLVSTSANRSSEPPCMSAAEIESQFGDAVRLVPGALGGHDKPSTIRDALTGKVLR